ncbi:MAG: DUF1592 domain-containing protein [Planctomycetales bacterium]|nr:DUF1592 domain-containing protein [Planctomycetales bacterium]
MSRSSLVVRIGFVVGLAASAGLIATRNASTSHAADQNAAQPKFEQAGVQFLEKYCGQCHGKEKPKADLSLVSFRDEAAVVKAREAWETVIEMVTERTMPPKDKPQPTDAEREAFLRLVADVFDRADRAAPPDPGHVTIRRLNKVEYNNTIRDLVGVDFNPAEDFPSDDVGHGFDNIGDVLSISPVLMERYLAAAESISQRAIVLEKPKPAVRPAVATFLQPRRGEVNERTMSAADDPLSFTYKVDRAGDYIFRVRAFGEKVEDEAPKIALVMEDKELTTVELAANEKSGSYQTELQVQPGEYKFAVKLLNPSPSDAEKKRTARVRRFELEGPADSWPDSHKRVMVFDAAAPHAEQTRQILTRFATRAFRRPVSSSEVDRLVKLVETAEASGQKWEAGLQVAMQAVLVSPKFLFRVELDDRPDSSDSHALDEYQLASRLSYFLWSSMPDDELFALAATKLLSANLEQQVRRMLADPRSRALVDNFAMQWLQIRRLQSFAPDPKLFPNFNEGLRSAMRKETELFVEAIIREDRSILELLDADFTFVNEPLARHYGLTEVYRNASGQESKRDRGEFSRRSEFVRVPLPDSTRGGLLTQASILTVTSNPTRTSPVKRGRWVLEQILGTPPPPPPPDVPELKEGEQAALTGSLRQRLEQHRANPICASCHARMDPLGFAFENYDAIGAFRTKEGEFAIDPSGTLPDGKSFQGPGELKSILKDKKDLVARNLTEKLLIYAVGRGLEYYDKRPVKEVVSTLGRDNYKFSTLVVGVVKSDPFRLRRGKNQIAVAK